MFRLSKKIISGAVMLCATFMITAQESSEIEPGFVLDSMDAQVENGAIIDMNNSAIAPVMVAGQKAVAPLLDTNHYYSIGGEAFMPYHKDVDYYNYSYAYIRKINTAWTLKAPVHLPHGAIVKEVRVYYYRDSTVTANIRSYLRRITLSTSSTATMATITSTGFGNYSNYDNTIDYSKINNISYRYAMYVTLPGVPVAARVRLHSVRIRYFHVY